MGDNVTIYVMRLTVEII